MIGIGAVSIGASLKIMLFITIHLHKMKTGQTGKKPKNMQCLEIFSTAKSIFTFKQYNTMFYVFFRISLEIYDGITSTYLCILLVNCHNTS